ncbi:putative leucine-rich repeat domain superfamily [Helianthus anomalus]
MGHILQGKQFDTFDNYSFGGNPKLCGLLLTKKCGEHPHELQLEGDGDEEESGFTWKVQIKMDYTILDLGGEMCIESPLQGKYYDSTFNYYNSHESDLPLSCEDDVVHVSHFEPLYEEDEDHTHEPETIMDVEVPPPVQQVINSSYWCPTPWDIDDGFWSDDDEGIVEEAELEVPDYTATQREEVCEPLDKMDNGKIEEHIPSWEEEFGDELVGLPTLEDKEFDPVCDLAYLETLLVEAPTMEIKYTPNVEEEVVEELDGRPVEKLEDESPPQLLTREKAQK